MEDGYCRKCKTFTIQVCDHNSGDTICSECGLVLESHFIDEKDEWRFFLQEPEMYEDPFYVGDRNNPFLSSGGLGTVIVDPFVNHEKGSVKPWKYINDEKDCNLLIVFRKMDQMADNLGLVETIKDCAKELYKKAEDGMFLGRLRNTKASMAACLYLACKEEGLPRTFKEIQANSDGAKVKEINKVVVLLKKHLEVGRKTTHAKDITRRYCSNLGLNSHTVKTVLEIVQKSEEFDVRRNSTSILAASIYMVTQISENYKMIHLREIAQACEVAESTMKNTYRDLKPLAPTLIPNWYADAEDIKRLCDL